MNKKIFFSILILSLFLARQTLAVISNKVAPKKVVNVVARKAPVKAVKKPVVLTDTELVKKYKQAIIKTNLGNITVEFYGKESPKTVANFIKLSQKNFYNGTKFHRVIKGFMIQGGDPNSKDNNWSDDGSGGPGYSFADEFNKHLLVKGSLAMANAGPNTNGSQFFIVTKNETPWLDGKHTNFGKVIKGLEVVQKIENTVVNNNDHPLEDIVIKSIELK